MSRALKIFALACALAAAPGLARAHDDGDEHEHGGPAAAERLPTAGAIGDLYEVLVKYHPAPVGQPMDLRVFVADARTNEAIAGAAVELTLSGAREYKLSPRPTDTPGVYAAEVTFAAAGDYDAVAKVSRAQSADLVTLGTFHAGLTLEHARRFGPAPRWLLGAGAGGGAVAAGIALWIFGVLRARRRKVTDA